MSHVKKVLDVLQKEKLYVKMSKCEFGKTSLVYLGHIVGGGKLKENPSKIYVIVEWPKTTNVIAVCSFWGVVQYWRSAFPTSPSLHPPYNIDKCEANISMGRKVRERI